MFATFDMYMYFILFHFVLGTRRLTATLLIWSPLFYSHLFLLQLSVGCMPVLVGYIDRYRTVDGRQLSQKC